MQNQPMVTVHLKFSGYHLQQLLFNLLDVLAGGEICAIATLCYFHDLVSDCIEIFACDDMFNLYKRYIGVINAKY